MKKSLACLCTTILTILPLLVLSGCWSATELNNRAFPTIMTVDLLEDGYLEVALGFPLPNRMIPSQTGGSNSGVGEPFTFISRKGKKIGEILRDIQLDATRDIFFGQTRVVVIGRRLASQGISPVIDLISRQPNFHISANLFVTEQDVKDIRMTPTVSERFVSTVLTKFIDDKLTINATVKNFLMSNPRTSAILLPQIGFRKLEEIEVTTPGRDYWISSEGAVMMSNGKMISDRHLTNEELRGALWITSQIDSAISSIKSPTDQREVTIKINNIRTKIKPTIKNNQIAFELKSTGNAYLFSSDSDLDVKDTRAVEELQNTLNKDLEGLIRQTFETTKQAKCDVFRLSDYLDWRYPKIWEKLQDQWGEYYAEKLPIDIDVDITINRTGTFYQSTQQIRNY